MLKKLTVVALIAFATAATFAQEKKVTVADFAGTWNIEMMSHQIALVIEPADGNKVTATMMMMGRDTPLKGELTERTLSLVGVKPEGGAAAAAPAAPEHGPAPSANAPKPIVITLQEDGTITGEMMTSQGPVKWTGEKLKTKKKG
jgi:hypothetical protein